MDLLNLVVACCSQAWILEQTGWPENFLFIQTLVPLIDLAIKPRRLQINKMILLQGFLYGISLAAPLMATKRSFPIAALFRSASPVVVLILKQSRDLRAWTAGLLSFLGLSLVTVQSIEHLDGLLFFSITTLASASLGLLQERTGSSTIEMSIIGSVLLLPMIQFEFDQKILIHVLISYWASWSVRKYWETIKRDSFRFSMALSLRRIISLFFSKELNWRLVVSSVIVSTGLLLSNN